MKNLYEKVKAAGGYMTLNGEELRIVKDCNNFNLLQIKPSDEDEWWTCFISG